LMMITILNNLILLQTLAPIPRDIDLPLPLNEAGLKIILVILFLVHILFVNLMVGGSLLSVIFEMLGLNHKKYDALGKKITETITVNKSLAVVLGVGPLLCINLAYTVHFYSANALTGYGWISIIPLVILAFLLAYLHKYTWPLWKDKNKTFHIIVGALAAFLFLCIPLIFLANINLMLFPEKWPEVSGFFSSLRIGNVFPRYFHFLTATVALTGLFLAGWFGRKGYPVETNLPAFTRLELRKLFFKVAFYATIAQLAFGPLLLFTLPFPGISLALIIVILSGVTLAITVLFYLRRMIRRPEINFGRNYVALIFIFTVVVAAMGTGRHLYRETSLEPHKALIASESERFHSILLATQMRIEAGLGAGEAMGAQLTGEKVFVNCAACHAVNKVLAAPSLVEVYSLYKDNPEGIVTWAKAPGKKRPEFAPMPSFAHLGDEKLRLVADYIIEKGAENTPTTDDSSQ